MKRINTISSIFLGLLTAGSFISAQTTYEFTNAGATGRTGPTQAQVNSAYANTNLNNAVTINTQGIQEWTVPTGGLYKFTVYGAQGAGTNSYTGGKGAKIYGEITLNANDVLLIVVGQQGLGSSSGATGGGGGTYVAKKVANGNHIPLIIAGGGSGVGGSVSGNNGGNGNPGLATEAAGAGDNCNNNGDGVSHGGGSAQSCGNGAGGGGGWQSDGKSSGSYGSQRGYGFLSGG